MDAPSVRSSSEGVFVIAHVTPSAKEDSVVCVDGILRVKTTAPADKGKANKAVVELLKPLFGPCEIVRGHKTRKKTVLVWNPGVESVKACLERLTEG